MNEYICLVDVEATCWDDDPWADKMETIEIGAVLIRVSDMTVVREYQSFIRPVIEPVLSPFCRKLTGIQQADVDAALTFAKVWVEFMEWLAKDGIDLSVVTFAAWGAYDEVQLRRDCERSGVSFGFGGKALNVKEEVCRRRGWRMVGQKKAADRLGIPWEGQAHRALTDARMAYKCLKAVGLAEKPVKLVFTNWKQKGKGNDEEFLDSIGTFRGKIMLNTEEKEALERALKAGFMPQFVLAEDVRETKNIH